MGSQFLKLQARPRDPFAQYLRDHRPDLAVPENDITLIEGSGGWDPSREAGHPADESCPGCRGAVRRGSRLYCPNCHRSGFEDKLAEQRYIAPPPARSRPCRTKPKAKKPGKTKRKGA